MQLTAKSLPALASRLLASGPVKTLATPRRIRIVHHGTTIADSTDALYVWEGRGPPLYYLPTTAFSDRVRLTGVSDIAGPAGRGGAQIQKLEVVGKPETSTERILLFKDGGEHASALTGRVRVYFDAVDKWLEEDVPVLYRPKDPFKRVDTLASTRRVRVAVIHPGTGEQVALADTPFAVHLYETGLPVRYYMPLTSIDQSLLRPSAKGTRTVCPYKGEAEYYDVVLQDGTVLPDLIWFYRTPIVECTAVQGLCCFYSEKVEIWVDEKKQDKP